MRVMEVTLFKLPIYMFNGNINGKVREDVIGAVINRGVYDISSSHRTPHDPI